MKNLTLTSLMILSCLLTYGQKTFSINGKVSTQLPVGTQSVTKTQALQFVDKNFNANKIALSSISKRTFDQIYITDNILVSVKVHEETIRNDYIQNLKGALASMAKGDTSFKLYTKSYNDYVVLVTTNKYGSDIKVFNFYSVNNDHNTAVTGTLQFALNDETKAETILNGIIGNIKFKVQ